MAVYTPDQYPNFLTTLAAFADGDLANGALFNASAENLSDNTRFLIDSLYSNLKSNIMAYVKNMGFGELSPLSTLPITFTSGSNSFNYTHAVTTPAVNPGDFLIIINGAAEIALDYIVMVTQNNVDPARTLYENFGGLSGAYNNIYKFEVAAAYESRYFTNFTSDIASVVESLQSDLAAGGRLATLDENALASSLDINSDGTKGNFTSTEIISSPSASYYTALQDLDKSFMFFSDVKADVIAKKDYAGTHAKIKSTLNTFGSTLTGLAITEHSLSGIISGNEDSTPPKFTYDPADACTITIAGTTCKSFRLSSEPGVIIESTITINVQTSLRELILDGLSFTQSGKIYITSNSNIDRLAITNCKINPASDMTDYWMEINQTAGTIGETIISNCKSDMTNAILTANTLYGIKTDINGNLILINNFITGSCYISSDEIMGTNNFFKCGKVITGNDVIRFIGDTNFGFNKFVMIDGYPSALAIANYFVSITSTNYCVFSENVIRNESTGANVVFPSLLKTTTSTLTDVKINNNIIQSVSTDTAIFQIPCIYLGEYKSLKFNDNSIDIQNFLACSVDDHYIYLATAAANKGGEFLRNSITVNTDAGGIAGGAGVTQSLTFGTYAAIILVNDPANILKINNNNFYFINRIKYVRLVMRTAALGDYIYTEENRTDIASGTDYSYIWLAIAPTVDDDWYYPQDKKIDDGYVFCAVAPKTAPGTGDIGGAGGVVINWSTYLNQGTDECVVVDCAGCWDGTDSFLIEKNGFYSINAMITLQDVDNANMYGIEIKNASVAFPAGITEMGTGSGFTNGPVIAGNTGTIDDDNKHLVVSAGNMLPLKKVGVTRPALQFWRQTDALEADKGHITFTIKRIY